MTSIRALPPIVTIDDYVGTYPTGGYQVERSVRKLESLGVLPLSLTSPVFPDINILAAWLMWSGNIHAIKAEVTGPITEGIYGSRINGQKYRANIHAGQEHEPGLEEVAERLSIGTHSYDGVIQLGTNGMLYARVCSFLVNHVSSEAGRIKGKKDTKAQHFLRTPEYVRDLARMTDLDESDEMTRKKLLGDHARIMMFSRLSMPRAHRILMNYQTTKTAANRLVLDAIDLFNAAYPEVGMGCDAAELYEIKNGENEGMWASWINVNRDMKRRFAASGLLTKAPRLWKATTEYEPFKLDALAACAR